MKKGDVNHKGLFKKYEDQFGKDVVLLDVQTANHRPHPFVVGAKHVVHASDHCGGMLGEETLQAIPCAMRGCTESYENHVCDTVAFIQLTRTITSDEFRAAVPYEAMEADGVDGFAFVETTEEFRIEG